MKEQVADFPAWLAPLGKRFKASTADAAAIGTAVALETGKLQVVQLSAAPNRLRLEHQDGGPAWLVGIIQREGVAVLQQGAVTPALLPERLLLLSSVVPFEIEFVGEAMVRQTWLVLPAEMVSGICPDLELVEPGVLQCADMHVQMLKMVADLTHQLGCTPAGQAGQHIAAAIAHLLAAAVVAQGLVDHPGATRLAKFHLGRIKQFVLANLHDPELTVRKVSAQLRISPAHIHRVFLSERQTFAEWLWERRLDACRDALEQPAGTGLSISQIAFSHGFSNPSHFSRAFKARFGKSPSQVRAAKKTP